MKVQGMTNPGSFTVERIPGTNKSLVRLFQNVTPCRTDDFSGYEYDEYHVEVETWDGVAQNVLDNYDVFLRQGMDNEVDRSSVALREGLDIPEVSLVAILDADKEGFLRSETSLIQTIGRAARNAEGLVILYADTVTPSMKAAMDETERRRSIQMKYNEEHGIVPKTIIKGVREVLEISTAAEDETARARRPRKLSGAERDAEIKRLEKEMKEASKMLEFEYAAVLRDRIIELRGEG